MSIESVMSTNHLILCHPLLFLPSILPSIRVFSNESVLFSSGGQSIGASASVLPMNIQGWLPLGWTGLISLQSKGLSRVSSNITVQKHQFFCEGQSLPSGSFHKPLILIHQRADRMKTTIPVWSHGPQPWLTQWNYEPCHLWLPKKYRSRWRALRKCGPLEKGMANHFHILALRTPWFNNNKQKTVTGSTITVSLQHNHMFMDPRTSKACYY